MKKINLFLIPLIALIMISGLADAASAQEKDKKVKKDKIKKEMVIQVNKNIIALPDNETSQVPISAAKIRSTEIRELNEVYNAVRIEKLFKKEDDNALSSLEIKGLKKVTKKKVVLESPVDLRNVFTKDIKKDIEDQGYNVAELNNVFIIQFEFDEDVNMSSVANAYKQLDSVIYAQHIVRNK